MEKVHSSPVKRKHMNGNRLGNHIPFFFFNEMVFIKNVPRSRPNLMAGGVQELRRIIGIVVSVTVGQT